MITLITVVKNSAHRIEATIKSVIHQKTKGVEYIVIDGASTDGTLQIVKSFETKIDQIVSEPDRGIYDALNKGIRIAKGSLIGLVHSGDLLLPDVLDRIAAEHYSYPDAIIYGCVKAMRNGIFENVWGWSHNRLSECMIPHPASFVPKRIYEKYGLYEQAFPIAGDYEAFLRYYLNKVDFRFIDLIVQEFDLQGVSQTKSSNDEVIAIKKLHKVLRPLSFRIQTKRSLVEILRKALRGARATIGLK